MLLRTHLHIQLSNSVALGWLAESKMNIGPCLRLWARGSPSFLSSVSLADEGVGAPQGAWPGLRQTGPGARDSRASPDRRALGVKRHAPRLAARQRGILAFRPLTVVGPGRLLVAGEAARVRPGDEVASSIARRCRSRSPLARRLMRTPLVEWIGMAEP